MFVKHFEAQNRHISIITIDSTKNISDEYYFFSLTMGSHLD